MNENIELFNLNKYVMFPPLGPVPPMIEVVQFGGTGP